MGGAGGDGDAASDFRRVPGRPLHSLQSKAIAGVCKHVARLSDMLVDEAAPFKQARHFHSSRITPIHVPIYANVARGQWCLAPVNRPSITLLLWLDVGDMGVSLSPPWDAMRRWLL